MAKAKATKQTGALAHKAPADNGQIAEKLTNKAEAIRRALAELGNKAKPAQIQDFIKTHFDIEMATHVISVYKSNLIKKGSKKGKPGRKPKETKAVSEPAPKLAMHEAISFRDMRIVKEISNRLGTARMRELVELIVD
jgi:hypothetical protein